MNENTKNLMENQLIGVQGEQGKAVYCLAIRDVMGRQIRQSQKM